MPPFTTSPQFSTLRAEAHRRAATPLGAPGLVWHLGFFFEDEDITTGAIDDEVRNTQFDDILGHVVKRSTRSRNRLIETARAFLVIVAKQDGQCNRRFFQEHSPNELGERPSLFNLENAEAQPPWSSRDTEILLVNWHGHYLKIIATIHNDYITITFLIDFSIHTIPKTAIKIPSNGDGNTRTLLRAIKAELSTICKTGTISNGNSAQLKLTQKPWDLLSSDLYSNFDCPIFSEGAKFADFRGIAISTEARTPTKMAYGPPPPNPERAEPPTPPFVNHYKCCELIDRYRPILDGSREDASLGEYAVCTMVRGRAIYMSRLAGTASDRATHPDDLGTHGSAEPLIYLVVVDEVHRWQIGRLIHRINLLGTLRLVAIRDLAQIRIASLEIRLLGTALDRIISIIDKDANGQDSVAHAQRLLRSWLRAFSAIGNRIPGGLPFRSSRSSYFVSAFQRIVADLDIGRIEGWQPYDEFVRRRLYTTFDFVRRVGERQAALRQRSNGLVNELSVLQVEQIQKGILSSHHFQHVVEVVAIGYYLGLIAFDAAKFWEVHKIFGSNVPLEKGLVFTCTGIMALLWGFYRLSGPRRRKPAPPPARPPA